MKKTFEVEWPNGHMLTAHMIQSVLRKSTWAKPIYVREVGMGGEEELHGQALYDSLGMGTAEDLAKTEAELAKLHELRKDPTFRARERKFWAGKHGAADTAKQGPHAS